MFPHPPSRAKSCIALLAILTLGLGGCGHAPEKPANARLNQAIQFNQNGLRALQNGDPATAAGHFEAALRLDVSIENYDGIVSDRLYLARALEAKGDPLAARKQLDALLAETFPLTAAQRAQTKTALALWALRRGKLDEAGRMADDALQACAGTCNNAAPILNIQARLALERGDSSTALAAATSALQMLPNPDQLAERANALRTIGLAKLLRGEAPAALESLQQALSLDRELGLPERIVDDLLQLRRVHLALGNASEANEIYRRALTVAEASADAALLDRVRGQ